MSMYTFARQEALAPTLPPGPKTNILAWSTGREAMRMRCVKWWTKTGTNIAAKITMFFTVVDMSR